MPASRAVTHNITLRQRISRRPERGGRGHTKATKASRQPYKSGRCIQSVQLHDAFARSYALTKLAALGGRDHVTAPPWCVTATRSCRPVHRIRSRSCKTNDHSSCATRLVVAQDQVLVYDKPFFNETPFVLRSRWHLRAFLKLMNVAFAIHLIKPCSCACAICCSSTIL